jgi:hypothetical protein
VSTTRQPDLPGVEMDIPEIRELAVEYRAVMDERRAVGAREKKLKTDLMAVMKENGLTKCNVEGVSAEIIVTKESRRVKVDKTNPDDDEAEDDDAA